MHDELKEAILRTVSNSLQVALEKIEEEDQLAGAYYDLEWWCADWRNWFKNASQIASTSQPTRPRVVRTPTAKTRTTVSA